MATRTTKKRVPASLKRVRKAVPRPTRIEPSKKAYRRKRGDEIENGDEVGC